MEDIKKLYTNYEILEKAERRNAMMECEECYLEILDAVKCNGKDTSLALQFVVRFFKHYPNLSDKSINALLYVCENEEVMIRKKAIEGLTKLCTDSKIYIPKISNALAQHLVTEDSRELSVLFQSFTILFNLDVKATLDGMFSKINTGEENVRTRIIRYLFNMFRTLPQSIKTKEVEEYKFRECEKIFCDVTGKEFTILVAMLSSLEMAESLDGQKWLVKIAEKQLEIEKDLLHTDADSICRLMECIKLAQPYFSTLISSAQFVDYVCCQVIPVISELPPLQEGIDVALKVLRLLADMAPYVNNVDVTHKCLEIIYNKLLEYIPVPPSAETQDKNRKGTCFKFSHIECLMFTIHQLRMHHPEFLNGEENAERIRDFKVRLHFMESVIEDFVYDINEAVKKNHVKAKSKEKLINVALRVTLNIKILIKDLLLIPEHQQSVVTLSWKRQSNPFINKSTSLVAESNGKRKLLTGQREGDGRKRGAE